MFHFINYIIYSLGLMVAINTIIYLWSHSFKYWFLSTPKLRKKYKTNWALITGGSSGIGDAMSTLLAEQGLNLFIVALGDDLLQKKVESLQKQFTKLKFIGIAVNFCDKNDDYIAKIDKEIKRNKANVGIVINNAGAIRMKEFIKIDFEKHMNFIMQINVVSALKISHYFMNEWDLQKSTQKRFIGFTSSCSMYFSEPYCSVYTAAKAFVRYFASSLSVEAATRNIDVLCLMPQIVTQTNFWEKDKVAAFMPLKFLYSLLPSSPRAMAMKYIMSMGRGVMRDGGWLANVLWFFVNGWLFGIENQLLWLYKVVSIRFRFMRMNLKKDK